MDGFSLRTKGFSLVFGLLFEQYIFITSASQILRVGDCLETKVGSIKLPISVACRNESVHLISYICLSQCVLVLILYAYILYRVFSTY